MFTRISSGLRRHGLVAGGAAATARHTLLDNARSAGATMAATTTAARYLSHYPIDERIFGLTEEQQQVRVASFNIVHSRTINSFILLGGYSSCYS